jgi:predicted O-methyltransferase YrrM
MARFRTARGERVSVRNLCNAPTALLQAVMRKTRNVIPEIPWIPFSAIARLESLMRPTMIAWEIGAGMSTLWLSQRVQKLTSIEAHKDWYARLAATIEQRSISNVDLRYEWVGHRMSDFSELPDLSLDFLVVDGGPRQECLENGFPKVRNGGLIYLDNTDIAEFWPDLDGFLRKQQARIRTVETFIDYIPAGFSVTEGRLLCLSRATDTA